MKQHQSQQPIARFATAWACAALIASSAVTAEALTPITTCGQSVEGDAELVGDLDCSSAPDGPVILLDGSLQLNGYTLTGKLTYPYAIIECARSCTVVGPGMIRNGGTGVHSGRDATLRNVTLQDLEAGAFALNLIEASGVLVSGTAWGLQASVVDLRDSIVGPNSYFGIVCGDLTLYGGGGEAACIVRDSIVTENAQGGIQGRSVRMERVSVTGHPVKPVASNVLRMKESTVQGNGDGVLAVQGRIRDSHILDNGGDGVSIFELTYLRSRIVVMDSVITGNEGSGVRAHSRKSVFRRSEVSGNCSDPPYLPCADIAACEELKVIDTVCGTSTDFCSMGTFGVCSSD